MGLEGRAPGCHAWPSLVLLIRLISMRLGCPLPQTSAPDASGARGGNSSPVWEVLCTALRLVYTARCR